MKTRKIINPFSRMFLLTIVSVLLAAFASAANETFNVSNNDFDWNVSGTNLFPWDLNYNVGIGTNSPGAALDVYNKFKVTSLGLISINGALSTYDAFTTQLLGENSTRFIINADGRMEWGNGSGPVDTDLYRSAANALRTSDSLIVDGNVGIGTASPTSGNQLDIVAAAFGLRLQKNAGQAGTVTFASSGEQSATITYGGTEDLTFNVGSTSAPIIFQTQGGEVMRLTSTDRVGIGDTSPTALLTVGSGDLFQVISTGEVRSIAGAVTAPTYSFTGDTNTGIYNPSADNLRLATGGSDRITVGSSGNVGIGTTNPGTKLEVAGNTTVWYLNATAIITSAATVNICTVGEIRSNVSASKICLCTTTNNWKCATVN